MSSDNYKISDHYRSLFCDSLWRIDGHCDSVHGRAKYFDLIMEYGWTGQELDCIECVTLVMRGGVRLWFGWGLN